MAKRRSKSKQWVRRQAADPFVKQRDAGGYRSRAAFKLKEILARDRLISKGSTVVDLGASPGGWSQVSAEIVGPTGTVVASDILPMAPLANVDFVQGDCRDSAVFDEILALVGTRMTDLVISDIAPNITGIRDLDEANFEELALMVRALSCDLLRPGGALVIKLFQFPGTDGYVRGLKENFRAIARRKPESSRKSSREFYVVATGFVI